MSISLSAIRARDQEHKDLDWVQDWRDQHDLYHDRARRLVQRRLHELKLGIKDDSQPIETSLLRFVVDSLAVAYRSPATRWLVRNGRRLDDEDPEQESFRTTLRRAGYDATMRRIDRDRTLYRQVVVRMYPDRRRRCVRMLPYSPLQVLRWPDPMHPDDMREDQAVAVQLSGHPDTHYDTEDGPKGLWEVWERVGPNTWAMTRVDSGGAILPASEQPYGMTAGVPPYEVLPMAIAYDDLSFDPWIAPRSSRTSYPLAIAATFNEVLSGIRWDSHPEVSYEQDTTPTGRGVRPSEMPQRVGGGVRSLLPPGVRANLLNISPQIGPALEAIERMEQSFMRSESLPPDAFRQSQTVTALGMRFLAQPLRERQEDLRPLVVDAERRIYETYARIHNAFAASWGVDPLPVDAELEVELGPLDVPMDEREETDVILRKLAGRVMSPVDAVERLYGLDRSEALARLERIREDWQEYPLPAGQDEPEMDGGDGPQPPSVDGDVDGPSVVGAVRALASGADG